jgi:ubiquinone/menaquinone biosynthesis C-methylase UbiE
MSSILDAHSAGCPCCVTTSLLITFVAVFMTVHFLHTLVRSLFGKNSAVGKTFSILTTICNILVALIAITLGALNSSPALRDIVFYKFAMKILAADNPNLDAPRCEHLSHVSGRVLEIGPGPATNFRCWGNNPQIVEWVGVEPNTFFADTLQEEKLKRNITFPISTIWLNSEANLNIDPESFDYVVGTHVLCSVTNIFDVLTQVRRALKPGGKYVFLEHVVADKDNDPMTYYGQLIVQPIVNLIGNGCLFRDTWNYLQTSTGLPGFQVSIEHRQLEMPISIFSPHIFGIATKLVKN